MLLLLLLLLLLQRAAVKPVQWWCAQAQDSWPLRPLPAAHLCVALVQMLLASPPCGHQAAALLLADPVLGELRQLLLEAQSGGVHSLLQQQVLARAAAYSLVRTSVMTKR